MAQFNIKVISVEPGQVKKYKLVEVTYKDLDKDKIASRKIMEFVGSYKTLKDAAAGEVYTITSEKDDNDYWVWNSAVKADGAVVGKTEGPNGASAPEAGGGVARSVPKTTYATSEERAAVQANINRSAAVARAIEFLEAQNAGGFPLADVLKVAKEIDRYISGKDPVQGLIDMQNDIPD